MKTIIFLIMLIFVGCATAPQKPLTREEWLNRTTHTFQNTTVDEVLKTAGKVLTLSDAPEDLKIQYNQNRIIAERHYIALLGFIPVRGSYGFDITATNQENDVAINLLITPVSDAPDVYELFFTRMESILYNKEWLTCEQVIRIKANNSAFNPFEALCFGASDFKPNSTPPTASSQSIPVKP